MSKWHGVWSALVTPFWQGKVDEKSLQELVTQQLDEGIQGFVVNGTTGESPTLTSQEVRRIFDIVYEVTARRVPIFLGTGSNCTEKTMEFTRAVQSWPADGYLVVVPYYNKPPQRGLVAHFEMVASCANKPIMLYNVPSRTVASLSLPSIVELSRHPNIIGIKEASGDIQLARALREKCRKDFLLFSGDDATCMELAFNGGDGVIAVISQVLGHSMVELFREASTQATAVEKWKIYAELIRWMYIEANPIPVKAALYWLGRIRSAELRLPLVTLDQAHEEGFKRCLTALKINAK